MCSFSINNEGSSIIEGKVKCTRTKELTLSWEMEWGHQPIVGRVGSKLDERKTKQKTKKII